MANTNSFNIDELKHALINSIGMLQNMYKYTSISTYNFNTIIDKSIADVNKLYSKTTKESIDELFEKRVSVYMSMFIRKSLLYGNSAIVTFIDMYTLDKNNIQEAKKMLNEIENIYINSYFIPSYNNINSLINTSFKLDSILNILYKNNIFDEYMESSDIIKTFIEVYCDRNNINLIELLTNTTINNSNNITEEIDSNTICILTKLFNLEDNLLIKNIIKDNPNIKCGLLINNVRQSILKGKNRSYNFLKFVNTYNKRIEYAIEDDYIIELAKLKKGIYKYLSDYSSEQIDNVIEELPSSYLIILHNSYGKSLRYYNFNKNLGLQSQKKLSVVLCTIKDYLRYINNEYKEEKVESSFYNKKENEMSNDLDALNDIKMLSISNTLSSFNSTENIVIMLKLGCVSNREYTNNEISSFLNIKKEQIDEIMMKFLSQYKEDTLKNIDNIIQQGTNNKVKKM